MRDNTEEKRFYVVAEPLRTASPAVVLFEEASLLKALGYVYYELRTRSSVSDGKYACMWEIGNRHGSRPLTSRLYLVDDNGHPVTRDAVLKEMFASAEFQNCSVKKYNLMIVHRRHAFATVAWSGDSLRGLWHAFSVATFGELEDYFYRWSGGSAWPGCDVYIVDEKGRLIAKEVNSTLWVGTVIRQHKLKSKLNEEESESRRQRNWTSWFTSGISKMSSPVAMFASWIKQAIPF